jgi:putative flippase GtrA
MVKLFSYALTGGTAAIVDAGSFVALLHAGLPAISAGTVSFCIAAVINYRLTARHVFSRDASLRGFLLFLLGALGGMLVNVGVTTFAITGGVAPLIAKILGIGVAFFVNFAINSRIVFAPSAPLPTRIRSLEPAPAAEMESHGRSPRG